MTVEASGIRTEWSVENGEEIARPEDAERTTRLELAHQTLRGVSAIGGELTPSRVRRRVALESDDVVPWSPTRRWITLALTEGRSGRGSTGGGAPQVDSRPGVSRRDVMPRAAGDRYTCEKCGAVLVYEVACPCPADKPHVEICCGQQMAKVPEK